MPRGAMRLPITTLIACLLSICLTSNIPARAMADEPDKVLLKNGDIITGHIASTNDETITLDTEAAGTIPIPRAAISQVILGHKEVVQPPVQSPAAKPSDSSPQNGRPVP